LTAYVVPENEKGGIDVKFKVEKMETVATCVIKSDWGPSPWKELKRHCL
jgi:hypothetical protein